MHPHRHQAGRGRHLAHQPTGIVGGKGGKNLQLGIQRIGLGARRIQRRTASIKLVRALVGPAAGQRVALLWPRAVYTAVDSVDVGGLDYQGLNFSSASENAGVIVTFW